MAASKSMFGEEEVKRMFASAHDNFLGLTTAYELACADLTKAKDLVERAKRRVAEYEAASFVGGAIPQDGNEMRRKYQLTLWRADDAPYVEAQFECERCERDAQIAERDVATLRFHISGAKRKMEFAIACLGGTVAQ